MGIHLRGIDLFKNKCSFESCDLTLVNTDLHCLGLYSDSCADSLFSFLFWGEYFLKYPYLCASTSFNVHIFHVFNNWVSVYNF